MSGAYRKSDTDVQDENCSEHTGWQCDFYFGSDYDVIEEDALNEKSCIEVLRILIRKEEAEIEELEKELLSLQGELDCVQYEKWPDLCISALTEKIDWLEVSISNLKNHHADSSGTRPLLHYKPAEPLHEIMKAALQRDYSQDACGQELIAKDSARGPNLRAISCASGHPDGMELPDASILQVSGNEEDKILVINDTDQIPNSCFSKDMENAPKEVEVVQDRTLVQYEGRVGSLLSDSQQSKSGNDGNSDLDQKLCDFASESEGRVGSKELIVLDEDSDYLQPLQVIYPPHLCLPYKELSSLKGDNDKNPPKARNKKNASLVPAKQHAKTISYSRSRLKGEEKSPARGQKSEIYANLGKSNMSFPSKQQNQSKRKPDVYSFSDRKPSGGPIKLRPKASTSLTSRGQQKPSTSIVSINEGCSNKSPVRKITETDVQRSQHETGEYAVVCFDSKSSELHKKRKAEAQTSVLQPDKDKLEDMKLADLRAIAKQNMLKGYYKCNKAALVELLKERLSNC